MKIALISFMIDPTIGGGSAFSVMRLAKGLASQGIDVFLITTHREHKSVESRIEDIKTYFLEPANLYWIGDKDRQPLIKKALWQIWDSWNLKIYRYVKRILAEEKPDIVHVNKLRGLSPSIWKAVDDRLCLIQTCRDYELLSPEGTLTSRVGYWASEKRWFIRPYQSFRARLSHRIDVATAPSTYTLKVLTSFGFFPYSQQVVVPNTHGFTNSELRVLEETARSGRPEDNLFRHLVSSPEKCLDLLYLGRLEKVKGVEQLCTAVAALVQQYPNLHLHVAGWGQLESALLETYGSNDHIHFHGAVFGSDKDLLLRTCDALIIPSTWPEVFGNVIVEAFAFGKPAIVTNIGGMPESIINGKTGFVIEPDSIMALEKIIAQLAAEPSQLREMSSACFVAARQFSIEEITENYLKLYNSCLAKLRQPRGETMRQDETYSSH
ncbi:MAG: glycosyltransferase family 4 protein [Chloroflexota bacterium]